MGIVNAGMLEVYEEIDPELRALVEQCGGDRSYTDLFYVEEAERILFAITSCDNPIKKDLTTPEDGSTITV